MLVLCFFLCIFQNIKNWSGFRCSLFRWKVVDDAIKTIVILLDSILQRSERIDLFIAFWVQYLLHMRGYCRFIKDNSLQPITHLPPAAHPNKDSR